MDNSTQQNKTARAKGKIGRGHWLILAAIAFMICAGLLGSPVSWSRDRGDDDDDDYGRHACSVRQGQKVKIATAKLYIEHNATDEDTGVHGAFDDHGWSRLCVFDPYGRQVLVVNPKNQLNDLTMAGIFFESREPPNSEFSIADLKASFPEGKYRVRGINFDGTGLTGFATFTHDIPEAPTILFPADGATVDSGFPVVISWEEVVRTLDGGPVEITGYQVIITKETEDDPNGFSRPVFDVHVPPDRNRLTVSEEFLEPGTEYELEILALEVSGNQTISVSFFETDS